MQYYELNDQNILDFLSKNKNIINFLKITLF